ncbi:MAG: hypothetical protein B7Z26_11875, partial [Asticcacaulis sp. 32-58-5]
METAANDTVRRRIIDYRMIWRWHFYAGLFCIPFIIILTVTGLAYLFKPQIEAALEAKYNNLTFEGNPKPISHQIYTAMHAMHGAALTQVEIRDNPRDALRVTLNDNGELYRLYVHPQTLGILKAQPLDGRFMAIIKNMNSKFGLSLSYHRITAFNINYAAKKAVLCVASYLSKEARANKSVPLEEIDIEVPQSD